VSEIMGCTYDVIKANINKEHKQKFIELYNKILESDLYDECGVIDEDCFEDNYFQCDECREYWSYDYVEFFHLKNGKTICENCREDHDDDEIEEE
jgi:hypothetical protein